MPLREFVLNNDLVVFWHLPDHCGSLEDCRVQEQSLNRLNSYKGPTNNFLLDYKAEN